MATASERTGAVAGPDGGRARLVAEVTARTGSTREATWIVEHVEAHPTGGGVDTRAGALALALPDSYYTDLAAFRNLGPAAPNGGVPKPPGCRQ